MKSKLYLLKIFFYIILSVVTDNIWAQDTIPYPIACYNFDGDLQNDDPTAGIEDLTEIDNSGTAGFYISGENVCFGEDSIYVFDQLNGLNLSKANLPAEVYSLEMFFQFTSGSASTSGRRRILRFKSENDAGLYLDADNRLVFQYSNSTTDTVKGVSVISEVNDTTAWMNISITRDGNSVPPQMIVYLDGNEELRLPTSGTTELLNDFKIFEDNSGGATGSKDESASGKIDYLRFYGEALDATLIDSLYSISILNNDVLISDNPGNTICNGEVVELTASGGDGTYLWSTGETTTSIFIAPSDTTLYWVQSTTGTPCDRRCYAIRDSITINVNDLYTGDFTVTGGLCTDNTITVQYTGDAPLDTANFVWDWAGGVATDLGSQTYEVVWSTSGAKNITLAISRDGCTSNSNQSITINPTPVSSFSAPSTLCIPGNAAFSYNGTDTGGVTYNWDFAGGTATNTGGENYDVTWAVAGTYTVSLTVTENGCSDTYTQDITVYQTPVANFSTPASGCSAEASSIAYTGTDDGSATYSWDFDGGVPNNTGGENYNVTWAVAGTYTVSLTVTENGCSDTYSQAITVFPGPVASFTAPSTLCIPGNAAFSYNGTDTGGATYTWDFAGGTATNTGGENYDVTWAAAGTYTVSLTVTENGCSDTYTQDITVYQTPVAGFNSPLNLCGTENGTIAFTGSTGSNANYTWDFNGGNAAQVGTSQEYNVFWDTPGTYTISLTVEENGCTSNTFTRQVNVWQVPTATFTMPTELCSPSEATVVYAGNASLGANYTWNFDGGVATKSIGSEIYSVFWPTTGIKTVSLTVTENNCVSEVYTREIDVRQTPLANFNIPANACQFSSVDLGYAGSVSPTATYTWSFDGGTVTDLGNEQYAVTWDTEGPKTVELTVTDNGCSATETRLINILSTPTAVITAPTGGCATDPFLISYTGSGLLSLTDFVWDWDGGIAQRVPGTQQYNVVWAEGGFKQVILETTHRLTGCTDTDTVTVQVNNYSDFTITSELNTVCNPGNTVIEFTGSLEDGATLIWDFDGGDAIQDGSNERYTVSWTESGEKTISVIAQGVLCPSDTATRVINVGNTPVAAFEVPSNLVCRFDANVITFTGSANEDANFFWDWDGGDATKISDNEYLVFWTTSGFKNISLYIEQDGCFSETVTEQLAVNNESDFTVETINQGCLDELVRVSFTGFAEPGANLSWDFGNGNFTLTEPDTYEGTWNTPGEKEITLIVEGIVCPSDTTSRTINIGTPPVISFSEPNNVCLGETVTYAFTGTVIDGQVITWDFADAMQVDSVALNTYEVFWETTGQRTINVSVNNNGCVTNSTLEVEVYPVPEASFTAPESSCINQLNTIQFNGTIQGAANYTWEFDGAEIVSNTGNQSFSLRWATSGTKYISLQIEENGCISEMFTDSVFVTDPNGYSIVFGEDILCIDEPTMVAFDGYAEPGSIISWDFGIDATSTKIPGEQEYEVSWATSGTKTVTLNIIGNCGTVSETKDINIRVEPVASFDIDNVVCVNVPSNIQFTGTTDPSWDFIWDFDGGISANTSEENYNVTWAEGGEKVVSLMINNGGCTTPIYSDTVRVLNVASFNLTPDKDTFCEFEPVLVQFDGLMEDNASLQWNFDGGISNLVAENTYEVYWDVPGPKTIELTVLGDNCPDVTFTRNVDVLEIPEPAFSVSPAGCIGEPVEIAFTGTAEPGATFFWDFNGADFTKDPASETYYVTWDETGSQRFTLQIDNGGCISEIRSGGAFIIDSTPFANQRDTVCAGDGLTLGLGIRDNIPGVTYHFDFDGGEVLSGNGLDMYEVIWDTPGDKEVTLNIEGLECSSNTFIYYVHVDETFMPEVAITADSLYCDAEDILIMPNYSNAGNEPVFRWFVNDRMVSQENEFSSNELQNGEEVYVLLRSSLSCIYEQSVSSNRINLNISDFAFTGEIEANPNPLCPGEVVSLSIPDIYQAVQWQASENGENWDDIEGATTASIEMTPQFNIYYRAWVTDGFCEDISPETLVEIKEVTHIVAADDRTIREGYTTELGVEFGSDYTWSPADSTMSDAFIANPVVIPTETTAYYVTGTTIEGCPSTDSLIVNVTPRLIVPNTFTPNGDNINDYWEIEQLFEYPDAVVNIYNRWGRKVYVSERGYPRPWDGIREGTDLPVSTYYYVIDLNDGFPAYKGSITIIR